MKYNKKKKKKRQQIFNDKKQIKHVFIYVLKIVQDTNIY